MNLRLSSKDLRFRISAQEYQVLCRERMLEESIELPGDRTIKISIAVSSPDDIVVASGMKVKVSELDILLLISEDALNELNPQNPSKDGLSAKECLSSGNFLKYSLQIDLKSKK